MLIDFFKMHGCGNDFIIINNLNRDIKLSKQNRKELCDRHFGIGADGIVLVEKRDENFYMNYFNSDGSPAEMCGNAMRCIADFIYNQIEAFDTIKILSRVGEYKIKKLEDGYQVSLEKADLSKNCVKTDPTYLEEFKKLVNELKPDYYQLASMGNPHLVLLVPDLNLKEIETYGPILEKHPFFKEGVNVSFCQIIDRKTLKIFTWERGDGLTKACGTGACASVSALNKEDLLDNNVKTQMAGGDLIISINDENILMSGPAQKVFNGQIEVR